MPWALLAIAAMQVGFSVFQQKQMQKAATKAQQDAARGVAAGAAQRTQEQQSERRQAQGATVLGGSPASEEIARQGSILTSNSETRSLLGG